MLSTLRKVGAAVAVLTAVMSILAAAAPASAADPNYQQAFANYQFGAGTDYTNISGYVGCPAGTRVVTTGATSGDRDSMLSGGSTTFDGTRGFHAAWGHDNRTLQLRATCVASSRLAGSFPTTLTVRDSRTGWRSYVKSVTCPAGTVAYGGGGNELTSGVPSGRLYTFGSMPSGNGWTYAATGTLGTSHLAVGAHCVPRAKLGNIVTVSNTATRPDVTGRPQILASARCPSGYFAFAGGAWYHPVGSTTPEWRGYLTTSDIAADERGWFAVGTTWYPGTQLTSVVRCTNRLG